MRESECLKSKMQLVIHNVSGTTGASGYGKSYVLNSPTVTHFQRNM